MKKTFTILIAAIAAIMLITSPLVSKGQVAPVDTELWKETWTGGTTDENPSAYGFEGTTVYGGVTLTYAQSHSDTKIKNEKLAGGTAPELLLKKGNTTWTISNIPTGKATEMSLTFKSNRTAFSVTSGTTGITITGSGKSWTISATSSVSNFELVIKNTSSSDNARVDDVLLKVTTASTVPTITITTPLNLAPNAVTDGVMTASYSSITPTSGSVTLWNNSACTEEFAGDETGLWLTAEFGTKATDFEKINYTVTENNTGSVRTAYMKVAVSGTSKVDANKVVTITQNTFQTVTFHGHGGYYDENDTYTQKIPKSVATDLELNKFVKAGSFFFKKWTTGEEGEGDSYEDGEEVTITNNLDLYAQWDEGYTVSLNSNGVITNKGVKKDESLTLTAPNNVPSGFRFQGWTATPTTPSSIETSPYTPDDDVMLYASFKKINSISYNKVTKLSDVTEGIYIITTYYTGDYHTIMNNTLVDKNPEAPVQSVSENTITGNVSNITWSFTGTTSEMTIQSTSNDTYYLNTLNTAQGVKINATDDDTWDISFDDTENYFKMKSLKGGGSRYLSVYISNNDWRNYNWGQDGSSQYITLFKKTEILSSEYYVRVFQNETLTAATTINGPSIIPSSKTLNAGSHLTNTTAANLIIEDGGQLICNNSVAATVHKTIDAWANNSGWYLLSSPITSATITGDSPTISNLITSSGYDLFRYNESKSTNQWENYKNEEYASDFTSFERGRGYLYRNGDTQDVTFTGNTNTSVTYNLSYANEIDALKGFNIIGNPFTHNITWTDITKSNVNPNGYYTLGTDGNWTIHKLSGDLNTNTIAPMQGFLVQANGDSPYVTFGAAGKNNETKANNDYIKFMVNYGKYNDVTYALFDKGDGINKIDHRNAEIPMLYISQDGKNYAIATMGDDTQMFDLSFEAKTMGTYTISMNAKGNFSYIHLIDRLTGDDTNLLIEDYSFIGSPQDNAERFIVKLSYDNGSSTDSETFAYQSGNEIIVNGEGTLEVYDVTGRKVMTTTINGVETINGLNSGVYIFRVIGETLKTQKIVVR